jgi:DNA-binding MarR family transcriptional regulator
MVQPTRADDGERKHIGQLLADPYRAFLARLHDRLAQAGYGDIHPAHGNNVFRHLRAEGSRLTDLAERAQLTKQSMGYLIDYLAACGYVERVADPTDGRARLIRLTARGWAVTAVAEGIIAELEAACAERLGAERFGQLRALLAELEAALAPEPGPAAERPGPASAPRAETR